MSVGVVIPTRNMASLIGDALDSALSQDPDVVVVIDDASEDGTEEVVRSISNNIRYERWPVKAPCHITASRAIYESIDCRHLIGLGADDMLLAGLVDAVRKHIDQAVVFTNYSCEMRGDPSKRWGVTHPYTEATILNPEQVNQRLITEPAVESGVGSSVRKDIIDWLWRNGWHELGPHSDSIGYASAAAMFGCAYVPIYGAHIRFNPKGYGQKNAEKNREHHAKAASEFMVRCGLGAETISALIEKRCNFKLEEQAWFNNV